MALTLILFAFHRSIEKSTGKKMMINNQLIIGCAYLIHCRVDLHGELDSLVAQAGCHSSNRQT